MHYVDRGPKPKGLEQYHRNNTPRWVKYYKQGSGKKPTDSHWRKFRGILKESFSGLCGYCETRCTGEVDHFQPKSEFPEKVYEWSNWIFSCHDCNNSKSDKWPDEGYVDPCARIPSSRPENYFEFDFKNGDILPKTSLSSTDTAKAWKTILDLGLNEYPRSKNRREWIDLVSKILKSEMEDDPGHKKFVQKFSGRDTPLSSVTRAVLVEMNYTTDESE